MKSKAAIIAFLLLIGIDIAPANPGASSSSSSPPLANTEDLSVPIFGPGMRGTRIMVNPDKYKWCVWRIVEVYLPYRGMTFREHLICVTHGGEEEHLFTTGQPERT